MAGHPSPSEAVPPAQDKTASIDAVRKQTPSKAVPLIVAAMRTHDDDWVPLSVIGSHVRAANPEFDPRTYGCAKLVDLLEKTGQFQVKRNEIPVRARIVSAVPKVHENGRSGSAGDLLASSSISL